MLSQATPREYDTGGLPSRYFNAGELAALLQLFESVGAEVVIEFGVNEGRNAVAALRNIPSIRHYIGVDVEKSYLPRLLTVQRGEIPDNPGVLARDDPRFTLIVKPQGTFDLVCADLPRADAVFIDADHSAQAVLHDRALALDVLRPGGLVIYHDDNCLPEVEVTQTLNALCAQGAPIRHVAGTWLAWEVKP